MTDIEIFQEAVNLVIKENNRTRHKEGFTLATDIETYHNNQLAQAGACYALANDERQLINIPAYSFAEPDIPNKWPWDIQWWKPTSHDRKRELVKAASLILSQLQVEIAKEDDKVNQRS